MVAKSPRAKAKKRSTSGRKGNDGHRLLEVIRLIPGYDPYRNAEGCWFDPEIAQRKIDFFADCLKHIEGDFAGKPFILELWQEAIVANLFGWFRKDERGETVRRFRECFIYVPRKNGKTPLVAGICLLVLCTDREPGAQIYSAAGDAEQAALLYRHAKGMVEQEPLLSERLRVYSAAAMRSIVYEAEGSAYKVLSSEAKTKHGHNTHCAIIDELHVQPDAELVEVMRSAMGTRKQPLLISVTTADFARESICNQTYHRACGVRDGLLDDSAFLPCIWEASRDDDWTSPEVWARANPNLGVSIRQSFLERECQLAKDEPSYENTFKRLYLNIITEQAERWLQMHHWDACESDEEIERGAPCFGGLDLSTVSDLSSFALCFPRPGNKFAFKTWFWCPRETARKRDLRVPYTTWAREGWMELTDGNSVDYAFIRRRINELKKQYKIRDIAFDPWNATQLSNELGEHDGFKMVEFRQGYVTMNEPAKAFEGALVDGRIIHDGNPVLKWCASNVAITRDAAGNIKPSKKDSTEKIDGVVACVMALGRAMFSTSGPSVYSKRGLLFA